MTGPRQDHHRMLALYNRWANSRLYDAAAQLSAAHLNEDRGAFFGSVLGTLNHLVATDRIWMGRLEGNSPRDYKLDEIVCGTLEGLRPIRDVENLRIVSYVFAQDEQALGSDIHYSVADGTKMMQPMHHILTHLFNHQAHHRGQAHTLICQIAGKDKMPSLDLLIYQRTAMKGDAP